MTEIMAHEATVEETIEKNYRWNFIVNTLDGASYWFGMSFLSATIILPLFVSHFTTDPLLIGLIPFLQTAGIFLPQLFEPRAQTRTREKVLPGDAGFLRSKDYPFSCWLRQRIFWRSATH